MLPQLPFRQPPIPVSGFMAFYRKPWFPFTLPFLLYFIAIETARHLPQWQHLLFLAGISLAGAALWSWRARFFFLLQLPRQAVGTECLIGLLAGGGSALFWQLGLQLGWLRPASLVWPSHWSSSLAMTMSVLSILCFVMLLPVLEELFWRAFMLRYLIAPDFTRIPLGTAQPFAFVTVVALAAIPAGEGLLVGTCFSAILYNLLLIWRKNLLCGIVAHSLANALIALQFQLHQFRLY
jgi:CAAX prenyl protease-like protein